MKLNRGCAQILAAIAALPAFASFPAHADPIGQSVIWTANPSTVAQGKNAEVILSAPATTCGTAPGQLNDANLQNNTIHPSIHAQAGFDVTAATPSHSGTCELTVAVTVSTTAKTGPLRLTITDTAAPAGQQGLGYATITVLSSQAGPIPDGLSPQVDVDLDVLGYQSVYDNYGRRIADNYFAVKVTIGNNTGFPLQLAEVGFRISSDPNDTPTPTAEPSIVQGTLVYGQDYSARNVIYRSLVWAALLGTGISPYFHAANSKANYAAGVALFSGPLLNGFVQQFPDNTVKQLARLNASTVMTDQNVIANNSQAPFIAFLSRDDLCTPGSSNVSICGSKTWYGKHTPYDAMAVKRALRAVTVQGNLEPQFAARIKVTVPQAGAPPNTGTISAAPVEGASSTISLQSAGLTGAVVQSSPQGVTPTGTPTDSSFPVSVPPLTNNGAPYSIVLQRKDGSLVTFTLNPQPPVLVIKSPANASALPANAATAITIGWQSGGPDLTHATITMAAADATVAGITTTPATLTATVTPKRSGPMQIQLTVSANNTQLNDILPLTITAK
jgi:hypothetical protein